MRKMCSCQCLNAQYQCLSPQWDLGGWNPLSQVTDYPAREKTKFGSLSLTLLSVSPVSRFGLPVFFPAFGGFDRQTFTPGWKALPLQQSWQSTSAQSFRLSPFSLPSSFTWDIRLALKLLRCRSVCHAADVEGAAEAQLEMQRHRWTALGWNILCFYTLWAWIWESSYSVHNWAMGTPSRTQPLTP